MNFELASLVEEFRHHYDLMVSTESSVEYHEHRAEVSRLGQQLEDEALILNATQTTELGLEDIANFIL